MAIICLGEVVAEGNPSKLVGEMQGKIWKRVINKEELAMYQKQYRVISTHLKAGLTNIHVYSDFIPDSSFEPVEADLEDVYFTKITERMDVVTV
jgi:hypothetical protein